MTVTQIGTYPRHGVFIDASAIISDDGLYRYQLTRKWSDAAPMTFAMLNPSTADAAKDDPTIRRCMGFARREGCGGIVVVNLFGLRVTRPVHLFDKTVADDPNGPENVHHVDDAIDYALDHLAPVVCAWGAAKNVEKSPAYVGWFAASDDDDSWLSFQCLGTTADGSPRHPLYVKADQPLEVWP